MNSKILRLSSILAMNFVSDAHVDAIQIQSSINFMPASYMQLDLDEQDDSVAEMGIPQANTESSTASATTTSSSSSSSSANTTASSTPPADSSANATSSAPSSSGSGANATASAPPAATPAAIDDSPRAPPAASNTSESVGAPSSSNASAASNGTGFVNATIATPAESSVTGGAGSAEAANATNLARNTSNPELRDETEAERSSTLSSPQFVNSTTTSVDLGNGTIMHTVNNTYRRREINRYARANSRQPDNDTMSVPPIENAKGPVDEVVNDVVVPRPRPPIKEKEPCPHDPVKPAENDSGLNDMLPYPSQYQNIYKNQTTESSANPSERPNKYHNNYETPSVGIPQAIQGSGLKPSIKYN